MDLVTRGPATSADLGVVLNIVTWILVASVILAVGVKLLLWSVATRRSQIEDVSILASAVLSIAYSSALSFASSRGLGRASSSLSEAQLNAVQKGIYAADILLVPTLATSQVSLLLFVRTITPVGQDRRFITIACAATLLWAFTSIWAVAFQCSGPGYWRLVQGQCFNQRAWWTTYGAFNIVFELLFTGLPIFIVLRTSLDRKRKFTVISCFACRLGVLATWVAALTQLHTLDKSQDFTHESWRYYICIEIIQSLAVVTQCIPYIRTLLLGAESGMIRTGHFRLRANSSKPAPPGIDSNTSGQSGGMGPPKGSRSWGLELQTSHGSPRPPNVDI